MRISSRFPGISAAEAKDPSLRIVVTSFAVPPPRSLLLSIRPVSSCQDVYGRLRWSVLALANLGARVHQIPEAGAETIFPIPLPSAHLAEFGNYIGADLESDDEDLTDEQQNGGGAANGAEDDVDMMDVDGEARGDEVAIAGVGTGEFR